MYNQLSTRRMRLDDWAKLSRFKPGEFAMPYRMGYEFMLWLDKVAQLADVPMVITSSARSLAHNVEVGGAEDSAHCDDICEAVDIGARPRPYDPHWNYSRYQIVNVAMSLGCVRIGIYADGSLHLDRTEYKRPAPRIWHVVDNPAR